MNLHSAARAYYEGFGIAWVTIEALMRVLGFLADNPGNFFSSREVEACLKGVSKFAKTGREASFFLRLLWHLGLTSSRPKVKGNILSFEYKISTAGLRLWQAYIKRKALALTILRSKVLQWGPAKLLIAYLCSKKAAKPEDIVNDLGNDMKYWTNIMLNLGLKVHSRRPVKKPFNNFVVKNGLLPLLEELGVIEKLNDKYAIVREFYSESRFAEFEILRTRPNEPIILSSILSIILTGERVYIISPWIDDYAIAIVLKALKQAEKIKNLIIVTRRESKRRIDKLMKEARSELTFLNITCKEHNTLHAKLYIDINGPALETSANLTKTSLIRNYETGTYYHITPIDLLALAEDIVSQCLRI